MRIEGDYDENNVIIVLVVVIVVDIDQVVIINDQPSAPVYQYTDGECSNPPPPWAPAHGWRAKCEQGVHPGDGRGRGN